MRVEAMSAFNSDPFIALLFRKSLANWIDEVDRIHICIHGENDEINDFIESIFKHDKIITYRPEQRFTELGQAYDHIYPNVNCDVLMTVDSDNFILKKGVVAKYAPIALKEGLVGYPGCSCKPVRLWREIGQKNYNMIRINTMLSWWSKKKLDELKFSFQRKVLRQGDIIEGIKIEAPKITIDTLAELTIKYLKKNNGKYHRLKETDDWFHLGGMSMFSKYCLGENGVSIYGIPSKILDKTFTVRKLAWHYYSFITTKDQCNLFEFNHKFEKAILYKIKQSGVRMDEIYGEIKLIKKLWGK
jgi:hypothetical protein